MASSSTSESDSLPVSSACKAQSSLGTRPFAGGGRVWARAYIRVVEKECNYVQNAVDN